MRKAICVLVVLCLLVVSPAAWAASPDLETALAASPSMRELQEIMVDIAARAALADPAELEDAYRRVDVVRVNELLGFTADEYVALDARLTHLRISLGEEFPELERRAAQLGPGNCGFSPSIAQCHVREALDASAELSTSSLVGQDGPLQDVDCQWGQYSVALALCTLAGVVFYWPCAYLALCSYCTGGWVTDVCV